MGKKSFILANAVVQAVFAIFLLANKNPDLHFWAIAPILASGALLILHSRED